MERQLECFALLQVSFTLFFCVSSFIKRYLSPYIVGDLHHGIAEPVRRSKYVPLILSKVKKSAIK